MPTHGLAVNLDRILNLFTDGFFWYIRHGQSLGLGFGDVVIKQIPEPGLALKCAQQSGRYLPAYRRPERGALGRRCSGTHSYPKTSIREHPG